MTRSLCISVGWDSTQKCCTHRRLLEHYASSMDYYPWIVTITFLGLLVINKNVIINSRYYSKEICDINGPGNITLCPLCDKACKYQRLIDSCKFARLTYLFDNPATVFFAIFMSLWGKI